MRIHCKLIECKRDTLYCVYKCPDIANCSSYFEHYDDIKDQLVLDFYIEKYGIPVFPIPNMLIKKQKAAAKQAKKLLTAGELKNWDNCASPIPKKRGRKPNPNKIIKVIPEDKKRHRRTKLEMEEFRSLQMELPIEPPKKRGRKPKENQIKIANTDNPKRTRRTKLQMEEARRNASMSNVMVEPVKEIKIEVPQKRIRRTKLQMEEARKQSSFIC